MSAHPYPLVVIYGRLTRLDAANGNVPFSGGPGAMFKHRTLDLLPSSTPIEIRTLGTPACALPYPPNARVLLLGPEALRFAGLDPNLNKHRGYCLNVLSPRTGTLHAALATYHPIDCWEFSAADDDSDDDDSADSAEHKDVAATKRANFFGWAMKDFWKLVLRATPTWPYDPLPKPSFLDAAHDTISDWLRCLPSGSDLVLDIECRPQDHSLDVIGLRSNGRAFVAPIYSPTNQIAFPSRQILGRFYRALTHTFLRDDITIVGHNLAFDLAVLAVELGLPIPTRLYDTMIAMHRAEPLLEKSLSHAISYYLVTPRNHKADICPNTTIENYHRLRQYNSEDLIRTEQLKAAQLRTHADNPGLAAAVQQGNELLHVTLLMSLTGIHTNPEATAAQAEAHLQRAEQMARVARVLTGRPGFNPASPDQTADFFYTQLHYPVLEQTDSGQPATGAKALYSLQTLQPNPLIPVIIEHRECKKAASSLKFRPFKRKHLTSNPSKE